VAEPLVEEVVSELRRRGCTVATGVFGARMQVSSVNEGPMTLLLEVCKPHPRGSAGEEARRGG
jgi:D-aminoacyl-tRNA deacylase